MMYSQHDEQEYILQNCPVKGRFLDIGAYHPTKFSNTRALYELGWSGVMVEPSPLPMEALLREYGNDERITLIQAVVAPRGGQLTKLHVTQDALSTTDNAWFNEFERRSGYRGGFYGSMLAPSVSIAYLNEFGPFDFVSIDTEGTSEEILREVVLSMNPAPKCICAETQICLKFAGYAKAYSNETNTVYVKS
jgi:FkbM family methyltransferase